MTPPSVPASVWLLAAADPVLIAVAVTLGWHASQAGKIFIAAMAALAVSILFAWAVTLAGLPWMAPVGREHPTLLPVRTISALIYAGAAYGARRLLGR